MRSIHHSLSVVMEATDGRSQAPGGLAAVSSHHERLLNEVEASDGQLGAILKWVHTFHTHTVQWVSIYTCI